jgi:hypothetical protein
MPIDRSYRVRGPLNREQLNEPIPGQVRRIGPGPRAFPAREARWNVTALAVWTNPDDDAEQVALARGTAEAIAPWSLLAAGQGDPRMS